MVYSAGIIAGQDHVSYFLTEVGASEGAQLIYLKEDLKKVVLGSKLNTSILFLIQLLLVLCPWFSCSQEL